MAFDLPLAERLARAATRGGEPTAAAHILLAEVLRDQARGDEAVAELERAGPLATDDDTRAQIAITRAETISLVLGDLDQALVVLKEAAEAITGSEASQRVAVQRTFLGAFAGDLRQVVEAAAMALAGAADLQTELDVVLTTTFAQSLAVQLDDVDERLARGDELATLREAEAPFARQQLAVCRTLARLGQGRVGAAFDEARDQLEQARRDGAPTGFPAICVAFAGCFTGDIEAAAAAGAEAVTSVREVDPYGVAGLAASLGAVAALQAGRPHDAERLLAEAGPRAGADLRAQAVIAQRVDAWREATEGSVADAAVLAAAAGRASVQASHRLWGAATLHDAVRFGRPDLVLDDLRAPGRGVPQPPGGCPPRPRRGAGGR